MFTIEVYNKYITAAFKAQAERPEDVASNVHDILVLFGKTNDDMVIEIKKEAPDKREPTEGQDYNITPGTEAQDADS